MTQLHPSEKVFLLHGLGGGRLDMWPLAIRLRQAGFDAQMLKYRSLGRAIESHVDSIGQRLIKFNDSSDHTFHLVTHSMGGVIVRAILAQHSLNNLGRVVMLAPPHRGSHVARKIAPWLGWLTPSIKQLSDAPDSFVNSLPNSFQQKSIEFGIVEATRDRVIASGFTDLEGSCDQASVDGHHGILTWYPQTWNLVESFLRDGEFRNEAVLKREASAAAHSSSPSQLHAS